MRITKKAVRKAKARKKAESGKATHRMPSKAPLSKNPVAEETAPLPDEFKGATRLVSGIWLPPKPLRRSWRSFDSLPARPPAQLYKYAQPNLAHIERAIIGGQVLFTNPLRFNDPFDCRDSKAEWKNPEAALRRGRAILENFPDFRSVLPLNKGEARRQHEEKMEQDPEFRENWLKECSETMLSHLNMGVCCLSANERSIQMWAHYAGNHTGVCYKFNLSGYKLLALPGSGRGIFPFFAILRVKYLEKFPPRENGELTPEGFPAEFSEKHREWGYEKEWRALMPDSKVPLGGNRLPPEWSPCQGAGFYHHRGTLDGVILGCRAAADFKKTVIDMANFRRIGVWEAKPKPDEYDFYISPRNQHAEEKDKQAED